MIRPRPKTQHDQQRERRGKVQAESQPPWRARETLQTLVIGVRHVPNQSVFNGLLIVGWVVSDTPLNPGCAIALLALSPGIRNVSDTGDGVRAGAGVALKQY